MKRRSNEFVICSTLDLNRVGQSAVRRKKEHPISCKSYDTKCVARHLFVERSRWTWRPLICNVWPTCCLGSWFHWAIRNHGWLSDATISCNPIDFLFRHQDGASALQPGNINNTWTCFLNGVELERLFHAATLVAYLRPILRCNSKRNIPSKRALPKLSRYHRLNWFRYLSAAGERHCVCVCAGEIIRPVGKSCGFTRRPQSIKWSLFSPRLMLFSIPSRG